MQRKISSTILLVVPLALFSCASAQAETPIVLSEIQTAGDKADDEFIELYNQSDDTFDLSGYQLRRKTSGGTESSIKVFDKNALIPGHGYYLWANTNGLFATPLADTQTSSSALADNNSVALFTKSGASGVLVDSLSWGSGALFDPHAPVFSNPPKNKSLTRNLNSLLWSLSDKHTPTNSSGVTYQDPLPPPPLPPPDPITYTSAVRLNEILANPLGDEEMNEFIELYNSGDSLVDLSLWSIRDASATGKYVFPSDTKIRAKDFLVFYRSTFKFALNNSDETISLLDPNGEVRDAVSYSTAKEGVSWNFSAGKWHGGIPTPEAPNQLNNLPETTEKVPKEGYRGIAIEFDAQGNDADKDTLKYTWDFGDGHKSYQEQASHTYEENGTYAVTLKTSDGKDDTLESFTLTIETAPRFDIRITALLANPSGSDTDNEWLLIANREKKTVNLKGYSITTGWKKLSNHPIRDDFLIGAKKERKLTHTVSLFTLPNQKGRIELRAPDGKVLQKIQYKLDAPIAEDVVYRKEKGSPWKWETPAKQISAISEKQTVPDVLGATDVRTDAIPLTPATEIPDETPIRTSDQISLDPLRPDPRDFLAYHTHVTVPSSLTLAPTPNEKAAVAISFASSETESIFSQINTTLNAFLNGVEE